MKLFKLKAISGAAGRAPSFRDPMHSAARDSTMWLDSFTKTSAILATKSSRIAMERGVGGKANWSGVFPQQRCMKIANTKPDRATNRKLSSTPKLFHWLIQSQASVPWRFTTAAAAWPKTQQAAQRTFGSLQLARNIFGYKASSLYRHVYMHVFVYIYIDHIRYI